MIWQPLIQILLQSGISDVMELFFPQTLPKDPKDGSGGFVLYAGTSDRRQSTIEPTAILELDAQSAPVNMAPHFPNKQPSTTFSNT